MKRRNSLLVLLLCSLLIGLSLAEMADAPDQKIQAKSNSVNTKDTPTHKTSKTNSHKETKRTATKGKDEKKLAKKEERLSKEAAKKARKEEKKAKKAQKAAYKQEKADIKEAKKAEKKAKKEEKKLVKAEKKAAKKAMKVAQKEEKKRLKVLKKDNVKSKTIVVVGKDGKKTVVVVKQSSVVTGPYKVNNGAKIVDDDAIRHKLLVKRIAELDKTLQSAEKRMKDLTDESFRESINFQLESLLNKVQYKGDVVVKVKRPPPKDPLDFRGEMIHKAESNKTQKKRIMQIIQTGNIPLARHTLNMDSKVIPTSKLLKTKFNVKKQERPNLPVIISKKPALKVATNKKRMGRVVQRKNRQGPFLDLSPLQSKKAPQKLALQI